MINLNKNINKETWLTFDELNYLKNIGMYTNTAPKLNRKSTQQEQDISTVHMIFHKIEYLKKYIIANESRDNWTGINKLKVMKYARNELLRLENSLPHIEVQNVMAMKISTKFI